MFKDSIVAIITPFDNNGIDIPALKNLVNRQIDAQTKGIVLCGTTGEGTLLTNKERHDLIKNAVQIAQKRIAIIVGCSSSSTWQAINYAKEAALLGADALLIMAPFYVRPTNAGIIQHFKDIHEATELPIILYNHPGRSGVDLSIETVTELFKLPRIVSLKDSNEDMSRVAAFKKIMRADKTLLSGDDGSVIEYMKSGGDGCISVTANIAPEICQKIMMLWKKGDHDSAIALNQKLKPLHSALVCETNPQPVKYLLHKMGFVNSIIKAPLQNVGIENQKIIDAAYEFLQQ